MTLSVHALYYDAHFQIMAGRGHVKDKGIDTCCLLCGKDAHLNIENFNKLTPAVINVSIKIPTLYFPSLFQLQLLPY